MNALEALRNIKREKPTFFSTLYDSDMWDEDIETIEKSLKALEIIERMFRTGGWELRHDGKKCYIWNDASTDIGFEITEEEYKILSSTMKMLLTWRYKTMEELMNC